MITVTCKACKKVFEIKERPIQRGGRDIETAECPDCKIEIYRGKTSGTFEATEINVDDKGS